MDQMSYCLNSHCLPAVTFPYYNESLIFIAVCTIQCSIFLPTWTSCRMHTPYSSLNSYCCENKYLFLFSPLLAVNLVEQQLFRALRKLPDSAQIKHCKIISRLQRGSASPFRSCVQLCLDLKNANNIRQANRLMPAFCKLGVPCLPRKKWGTYIDCFDSLLRMKVVCGGGNSLPYAWLYHPSFTCTKTRWNMH